MIVIVGGVFFFCCYYIWYSEFLALANKVDLFLERITFWLDLGRVHHHYDLYKRRMKESEDALTGLNQKLQYARFFYPKKMLKGLEEKLQKCQENLSKISETEVSTAEIIPLPDRRKNNAWADREVCPFYYVVFFGCKK